MRMTRTSTQMTQKTTAIVVFIFPFFILASIPYARLEAMGGANGSAVCAAMRIVGCLRNFSAAWFDRPREYRRLLTAAAEPLCSLSGNREFHKKFICLRNVLMGCNLPVEIRHLEKVIRDTCPDGSMSLLKYRMEAVLAKFSHIKKNKEMKCVHHFVNQTNLDGLTQREAETAFVRRLRNLRNCIFELVKSCCSSIRDYYEMYSQGYLSIAQFALFYRHDFRLNRYFFEPGAHPGDEPRLEIVPTLANPEVKFRISPKWILVPLIFLQLVVGYITTKLLIAACRRTDRCQRMTTETDDEERERGDESDRESSSDTGPAMTSAHRHILAYNISTGSQPVRHPDTASVFPRDGRDGSDGRDGRDGSSHEVDGSPRECSAEGDEETVAPPAYEELDIDSEPPSYQQVVGERR